MENSDAPKNFEELLERCKTLEAARTILGENYFQQAMSEPVDKLIYCCTQIAFWDWGCPEHSAYEFILKQRTDGFTQ